MISYAYWRFFVPEAGLVVCSGRLTTMINVYSPAFSRWWHLVCLRRAAGGRSIAEARFSCMLAGRTTRRATLLVFFPPMSQVAELYAEMIRPPPACQSGHFNLRAMAQIFSDYHHIARRKEKIRCVLED